MKLSIWDMDKTIIRRASWTPWLLHFARTQAPLRLLLVPLLLLPLAGYALRMLDRAALKQATQRIMMGRRVQAAAVHRAAAGFAAGFGAANEMPGALEALAADRAEGFLPVVATASPRFYVEALADRWGIHDVIATENRWDGYALTPKIDGENCYGIAKFEAVEAWLAARGLRRADCEIRFASDHESDLPLLLWADAPLAANPSPALRREATARGWRVADWA
jgi:HAD superfamily phosphoserine phosphatase-like hydrolase